MTKIFNKFTKIHYKSPASADALMALCSTFYEEENETSVLKILVSDDWKTATVTSKDEDGISAPLTLTCDGQPTMNQELKYNLRIDAPDIGHMSMVFSRDVNSKMTLIAEAETPQCGTKEINIDTLKFDCVQQ